MILVDEADREVGTEEKLAAHRRGVLHRAFSVFVFDPTGRVLLQRRATGKYHSAGLWSNTCCGHPRPGEETLDAARRRLREEMGIDCALEPVCTFRYRAELGGGLCEHELDHVLLGLHQGEPQPDPAEVAQWRWLASEEVEAELTASADRFTSWFPVAWRTLREHGFR